MMVEGSLKPGSGEINESDTFHQSSFFTRSKKSTTLRASYGENRLGRNCTWRCLSERAGARPRRLSPAHDGRQCPPLPLRRPAKAGRTGGASSREIEKICAARPKIISQKCPVSRYPRVN